MNDDEIDYDELASEIRAWIEQERKDMMREEMQA